MGLKERDWQDREREWMPRRSYRGEEKRSRAGQKTVLRMGYSGAEVFRFLGLTTSAVNRLVSQKEMPECKQYK